MTMQGEIRGGVNVLIFLCSTDLCHWQNPKRNMPPPETQSRIEKGSDLGGPNREKPVPFQFAHVYNKNINH